MEKIIRRAKAQDVEAMKALWIECFPKDAEYSKFFFRHVFRLECARVCEIDGEIAAMLHSFPYNFTSPEGEIQAKYIYGVGTSELYRGQGLAGRLLEFEARDCDFIALIPQNESLFDFYNRYGYTELFEVKKTVISPNGSCELRAADERDIAALNEMYENMCRGYIHPIRSRERWRTILSEFKFLGGGIALFDGGYCVYYTYEGKPEICELCADEKTAAQVAGAFGCECPVTTVGGGIRLGAVRLLTEKAKKLFEKGYGRYLNLMHN